MSPNKTPLQIVNEEHGGKDKLVEKIMSIIERGEEETDALKSRLRSASNTKLLKIQRNAQAIKDKYGSKDKVVQAAVALMGRAKDNDYIKKLGTYAPGRILDLANSLARRNSGAARPAEKAPKAEGAAAKAAPKAKAEGAAKKPAAAKAAAKPAAKKSK